jgi:nucleotide-binding universal stress UspA family protein
MVVRKVKRIVIWATDGSENADAALDEAIHLGELLGAKLCIVHADERLEGRAAAWPALPDEEDRRRRIRERADELAFKGFDVELIFRRTHREAADIVGLVAEELDADLIVCGTHGAGALAGAVFGSFAHRLLHVAPCPVLVVPAEPAARRRLRTTRVATPA